MPSPTRPLLATAMLALTLQAPPIPAAPTQGQLDAIARMGELNGIALQCRFVDQTRRIKQELIKNLPKQRALGEWFERKTTDSFMRFMREGGTCPGLIEFDHELDAAAGQLEEAFGS